MASEATSNALERQASAFGLKRETSPSIDVGDSGVHLFHDIFRRADKNDDGRLSKEEFREYFRDDLLNDDDLNQIFTTVDLDHSGSISLDELAAFFKQGFQPFNNLFAYLEKTHEAISGTLTALAKEYSSQDFLGQFRTRFFLREFLTQTTSFHRPIEAALEGLERQSAVQHNRNVEVPEQVVHAHHNVIHEPRLSFDVASLRHEIEKLSSVVTKLSAVAPKLELSEEFSTEDATEDRNFYVVSRKHFVKGDSTDAFIKALKQYLKQTKTENGYFHVHVKRRTDLNRYDIYEIWTDIQSYEAHKGSAHAAAFVSAVSSLLEKAEESSAMYLPATWWPLEKQE